MTVQTESSHLDPEVISAYLDRTRWFGGKGRPYSVTAVHTIGELPDPPPVVVIHVVELAYADAEGGTELYQVPMALYEHPEHRLDHAFIGWWEDPERGWVHAYDALHDREAMALWQRAFADGLAEGGLVFHRLPGHELDLRRWEGLVPVELLGGVPFPAIGELPYLLTLGGYGFYWFRLMAPDDAEEGQLL